MDAAAVGVPQLHRHRFAVAAGLGAGAADHQVVALRFDLRGGGSDTGFVVNHGGLLLGQIDAGADAAEIERFVDGVLAGGALQCLTLCVVGHGFGGGQERNQRQLQLAVEPDLVDVVVQPFPFACHLAGIQEQEAVVGGCPGAVVVVAVFFEDVGVRYVEIDTGHFIGEQKSSLKLSGCFFSWKFPITPWLISLSDFLFP